ncbi:hypothetical protein AAVH_10775 [Aphelenchoides avenae]|nr:hypothetical protein AAVH_10775 [Aphelenchus avenae]
MKTIKELPYIPKTSNQLGSMVIQDGVVVKLANVGTSDAIVHSDEPLTTITLGYSACFYVVVVSGRWICCVKRRVTATDSSATAAAPLPAGPPGFEVIRSVEASP